MKIDNLDGGKGTHLYLLSSTKNIVSTRVVDVGKNNETHLAMNWVRALIDLWAVMKGSLSALGYSFLRLGSQSAKQCNDFVSRLELSSICG